MMETAPVAPFVVAQSELLFEFLIVAFDPPAGFAGFDQLGEGHVFAVRREPVAARFCFVFRPFDDQPFLRAWDVAVGGAYADSGKTRTQRLLLTPPHRGAGAHPERIDELVLGEPVAQVAIVAVGSIPQHRATWFARLQRGFNLRAGNRVLGRKRGPLRHTCRAAAFGIVRPLARKIQALAQPQAPGLAAQGQADGDATIVGFAHLFSVLPCYGHRMRTFPGKTGVVNDPGAHGVIAPFGVGNQMMHRLMRRTHLLGMHSRRHRLNVLPAARQHQPLQIPARGLAAIRVRQHLDQCVAIGIKSPLHALNHGRFDRRPLSPWLAGTPRGVGISGKKKGSEIIRAL